MKHESCRAIRFTKLAVAIRTALFSVTATTFMTFGLPAKAQTMRPASGASFNRLAHNQPSGKLLTLTVATEKNFDSERNVPISASVVDAAGVLNIRPARLDDFYATVPNVNVNDRSSCRTNFVVPGTPVGKELYPTMSVSIDDVPYGSSNMDYSASDLDPFDIDHIEVLRGTLGNLYGASSRGGLI